MSHLIVWNREIVEEFERLACLSEYECRLLESRVQGATVRQQAFYFNRAESTIHRDIRMLKIKYREAQKRSDILPPMRNSVYEKYQDTH